MKNSKIVLVFVLTVMCGMAAMSMDFKVNGIYVVTGDTVDMIFSRINPNDEDSMRHFQKLLVDFGIIDALRQAGAKDGDTVALNDLEFEFYD